MMRELIHRFSYRFELWRRDLREDLSGEPRTDPRSLREYRTKKSAELWSSRLSDPKWVLLLTESKWRSVVRSIGVYLGAIIIAALICRLLVACFPAAEFATFIIFLVLVRLWTL